MTIKKLLSAMLACGCSVTAFADGIIDSDYMMPWVKVLTLSGGPAWSHPAGETQVIPLIPSLFTNTYEARKHSNTMFFGSLFFGLQTNYGCCVQGQWGIELAGAGDAELQGNILSTGSAYEYQMNHGRVSFRGKLQADPKIMFIQPYITGSIGAAFNHSFNYTTLPAVNPVISPRYYNDKTELAFAWTAGGGLQMAINKNWQAGVGYEFVDWGKSSLGRALSSPFTNIGPQLSHLYSHQAVFSISYLC